MSKFNRGNTVTAGTRVGPLKSEQVPTLSTFEGHEAYKRDAKSELFLLAVSNMVGENTFYESAANRDARYEALIAEVAVQDFDWLFRMLVWLRSDGNMRSASLVGAVEAVRARLAAKAPDVEGRTHRALISAVCQRADEPGEILAYWLGRYGKAVPMPIKRGIADACVRLYNERSFLKYDTGNSNVSFGDVIEISHAKTSADWQNALFRYAMDKHGRNELPEALAMLNRRKALMSSVTANTYEKRLKLLTAPAAMDVLAQAGMTWEAVSGWLQGPMTAKAWEAIIPSMGYMALLRNLRNFDEARISDEMADKICAKIQDAEEVAKSRQFPFRFWSAYHAAPSNRWASALERALTHSLKNLPELDESLILVDTSGSMTGGRMSAKSQVTAAIASAIFGVSLCTKPGNHKTTLVAFADRSYEFHMPKGASALRQMEAFLHENGKVGAGTALIPAIQQHFRPGFHNRVIIISDMQCMGPNSVFSGDHFYGSRYGVPRGATLEKSVPDNIPMYAFNIGGYKPSPIPLGPNRNEFGGLTDMGFRLIPLIEAGQKADWPF